MTCFDLYLVTNETPFTDVVKQETAHYVSQLVLTHLGIIKLALQVTCGLFHF